jgi:thymidylate synthase (FAD)
MKPYLPAELEDIISPPAEVRILSRPTFDLREFETFLAGQQTTWEIDADATGPELLVEAAGRVCYMSFGERQFRKDNRLYIENLIAQGHESVLEHASWTFLIAGVSRAFTHQLVRHRAGFSFSQLSQQYHDESEALFVPPEEIRTLPEAMLAWANSMRQARETYREILTRLPLSLKDEKERKRMIHSAARSALPNCTETKIVVTANARSIRHFLAVRGTIVGDLEMRQVASMLLKQMQTEASSLFSDFLIRQLNDGFPIIQRTPRPIKL